MTLNNSPRHFRQQCGHAEVPCDAPSSRCNIFSVACQASQTFGSCIWCISTIRELPLTVTDTFLHFHHNDLITIDIHAILPRYSSYFSIQEMIKLNGYTPRKRTKHGDLFQTIILRLHGPTPSAAPPWKTNPSFAPPRRCRRFCGVWETGRFGHEEHLKKSQPSGRWLWLRRC